MDKYFKLIFLLFLWLLLMNVNLLLSSSINDWIWVIGWQKEECVESSSSQSQDVHVQKEWLKDWRRIWWEEWITTITVVYGSRTWVVCLSDWRDVQVMMKGKIPVLLLSLLVSHTSLSKTVFSGNDDVVDYEWWWCFDSRQDKASDSFRSGFKKESRTERSKQTARRRRRRNPRISHDLVAAARNSHLVPLVGKKEGKEKKRRQDLECKEFRDGPKKITVVDSSFSSSLPSASSLSMRLSIRLSLSLWISLVSLLLLFILFPVLHVLLLGAIQLQVENVSRSFNVYILLLKIKQSSEEVYYPVDSSWTTFPSEQEEVRM